jgi:hypothetical protein
MKAVRTRGKLDMSKLKEHHACSFLMKAVLLKIVSFRAAEH